MSGVHGEIVTTWLSQDQLDELTRKYGNPSKPLNYYKGRLYTRSPKESETMKTCSWNGCNKKHYAKGYCSVHYHEAKKGMRSK